MSRIHDALKRAEEDRAAAQGSPTEAPGATEAAGVVPIAPGFSPQFTLAAMLARCPQTPWNPDPRTMLFFGAPEPKQGQEEFRTLRSRLYQAREKINLKKVLITSALPKEGKSFVAANLAQVLVQQPGRRALLIDADLRGPRLHAVLGTSSTPGLSEYLLGEVDELSILQRGPMEGLFLIAAGRMAANAAELVANGRLKSLLTRFEQLFDWIIIDSPPAVPVTDASLMASYCDGVLMVVRSNATPSDAARKARMEFNSQQLLGVVLNGIASESAEYYERYYSSGNGVAQPGSGR